MSPNADPAPPLHGERLNSIGVEGIGYRSVGEDEGGGEFVDHHPPIPTGVKGHVWVVSSYIIIDRAQSIASESKIMQRDGDYNGDRFGEDENKTRLFPCWSWAAKITASCRLTDISVWRSTWGYSARKPFIARTLLSFLSYLNFASGCDHQGCLICTCVHMSFWTGDADAERPRSSRAKDKWSAKCEIRNRVVVYRRWGYRRLTKHAR